MYMPFPVLPRRLQAIFTTTTLEPSRSLSLEEPCRHLSRLSRRQQIEPHSRIFPPGPLSASLCPWPVLGMASPGLSPLAAAGTSRRPRPRSRHLGAPASRGEPQKQYHPPRAPSGRLQGHMARESPASLASVPHNDIHGVRFRSFSTSCPDTLPCPGLYCGSGRDPYKMPSMYALLESMLTHSCHSGIYKQSRYEAMPASEANIGESHQLGNWSR